MDLYILRHAIASERGTLGIDSDFERDLTPEGEQKLRQITRAMRRLELSFDLIWSSPYIRARRTAEIVVEQLKCRKRVELHDNLSVEANPRELIAEIKALNPRPDSLLIVGHEPLLSSLISLLIAGADRSCVTLKKAGFCKLSADSFRAGGARLEWLLTPRQMMLMK
jgi:phosphohistidine phosphatase